MQSHGFTESFKNKSLAAISDKIRDYFNEANKTNLVTLNFSQQFADFIFQLKSIE